MKFSMEHIGNNEPVEPEIINKGIESALLQVKSLPSRDLSVNTDESLNLFKEKETLAFHGIEHTKSVVDRYEKIINLLKKEGVNVGSDREVQIGKLGASFHDTVQNFVEDKQIEPEIVNGNPNKFAGFEKVMRKRAIKENEKQSSELAISYMREVNKTKPNTFNTNDEEIIKKEIDVTVPGFSPQEGTVIQPNLDSNSQSTAIERALALSDIGTSGMESSEMFLGEGDALFREENLDIMDAIYKQKQGEEISDKNKEYYKHRMLGWSKFQPVFASGRKKLLDKEIKYFPANVQQKIKDELFNKFDESIKAASDVAQKRESMTFEETARDMGYYKSATLIEFKESEYKKAA